MLPWHVEKRRGAKVSRNRHDWYVLKEKKLQSKYETDSSEDMATRGGIWLQSQRPSTSVYGDYSLIIAINSSFSVNNRTRSAAECHLYWTPTCRSFDGNHTKKLVMAADLPKFAVSDNAANMKKGIYRSLSS